MAAMSDQSGLQFPTKSGSPGFRTLWAALSRSVALIGLGAALVAIHGNPDLGLRHPVLASAIPILTGILGAVCLVRRKIKDGVFWGIFASLFWVAGRSFPLSLDTQSYWQIGKTKGQLGAVRSILSELHRQGSAYPRSLDELHLDPAGLVLRPYPYHDKTTRVETSPSNRDTGTWAYDPATGRFWINCAHFPRNSSFSFETF